MNKIKIFWSYACADLQPIANVNTSWLAELAHEVRRVLGTQDSRGEYEIIRDSDGMIKAGDVIDEQITENIEACDLGILVISDAYLRSKWCAKEAKLFLDKGKPVLIAEMLGGWNDHEASKLHNKVGALHDRILRVELWHNLNGAEVLKGFPAPSCAAEGRKEFDFAVIKLCDGIKKQSKKLRDKASEKNVTPLKPVQPEAKYLNGDQRYDLFLAHCTQDCNLQHQQLKSNLKSEGFSVLHLDMGDPNVIVDWDDSTLTKLMKACNAYAQVIGGTPGIKFLGTDSRFVKVQYDAAGEAGLKRYVSVLPDLRLDECDEAHQDFLANLEVSKTTFEDFENFLIKSLNAARETLAANEKKKELQDDMGDLLKVAIDCAPEDRDKQAALAEMLLDKGIMNWRNIVDTPKNKELMSIAQISDGIVVVYGESISSQKRAVSQFSKFLKYSRKKRCHLALGVADPEAGAPPPSAPNVPQIYLHNGVDAEGFNQFLSNMTGKPQSAGT
ncbi:MAG: toll/interleukin-1 receptor domain-containing protein [Litorimonas sp.]